MLSHLSSGAEDATVTLGQMLSTLAGTSRRGWATAAPGVVAAVVGSTLLDGGLGAGR